jgi:hypothetical protein
MQIVTLPLQLSLVGVRLTGYMIETNLRVAQVLCRAAIQAHPMATRSPGYSASKPRSKPVKPARTKTGAGKRTRQPAVPPAMPKGGTSDVVRLS